MNALLKFLFIIMAEEERPLSVSELHNLFVRKLFNAQFIISALFITLVNANLGIFLFRGDFAD